VGCARTGDELIGWANRPAAWRASVWRALPARFARLGIVWRRLPWAPERIRTMVASSLTEGRGTWVAGLPGTAARFSCRPGAAIAVRHAGDTVVAEAGSARLRFRIDATVHALRFEAPCTPDATHRTVLAVTRARGRAPAPSAVTDLGPDTDAIRAVDRAARLYDLGLGHKGVRLCLRAGPGAPPPALPDTRDAAARDRLDALAAAFGHAGATVVLETTLGRMELRLDPQDRSSVGAELCRLADLDESMPPEMDLPRAYLPGAVHFPTAGIRPF
jgi:hypothetical protein